MARGDGTGGGAYSLKKVEVKLLIMIQKQDSRIKQLETQMETLLKETKGSTENEILKVKKLDEFSKADLKKLSDEYGINDTDFKNKADYVKALKAKDKTLV
jgi:predicted RNase H-like nuclease (RuvC/YqgF family)